MRTFGAFSVAWHALAQNAAQPNMINIRSSAASPNPNCAQRTCARVNACLAQPPFNLVTTQLHEYSPSECAGRWLAPLLRGRSCQQRGRVLHLTCVPRRARLPPPRKKPWCPPGRRAGCPSCCGRRWGRSRCRGGDTRHPGNDCPGAANRKMGRAKQDELARFEFKSQMYHSDMMHSIG